MGTTQTSEACETSAFFAIIGQSPKMTRVFDILRRIADTDSTVIVYGESGTGKELVARAIHNLSDRRDKPFVAINCGAIPENLLESELFGHVKGSFTGAVASKPGKFQLAQGGTLFLDEIGDMSPDLQVKLLRVLELREVERVGGGEPIPVDVRIVSATHRNLEEEIEKGRFREDLFYRLHVIPVTLPPLRERRSDIPVLFNHFIQEFNTSKRRAVDGISREAMEILHTYHWPGNVRELKNVTERMVILKGEGTLDLEDLPSRVRRRSAFPNMVPSVHLTEEGICLNTAVNEFEKALILQSLEKTQWVKRKAAELLGLNRTTLVEKIKRHRLEGGNADSSLCAQDLPEAVCAAA